MSMLARYAVFAFILTACASAATPTPLPTPTQLPTRTPMPIPTMTAYESIGIPACDGFTVLPGAVPFSWEGLEEVAEVGDWGYYACAIPVRETSALYRTKMIGAPYNWQEFNWVDQPQGSLGVYFHAVFQKWLYLWFLPNPSSSGSVLVAATREIAEPLDLPCCH